MSIFKCKMCGGDLNINEGVTVVECEYCGTNQTVPSADNEKKLNLFNRANRLRINGEFDKATAIYENIVAEFPEEAEAYWGLVICNYGIEYVDDPATARKIPTCHRASFESIQKDENFEMALEYADVVAQKVYRDEAREIDRIREEILSVSKNEQPYDIFICYKETAENGERTVDSVLAQDVYDVLTAKGYRVFFARISLEDKLGRQYEPYIFAALNSAKIMLSLGTKYEYFHAVWVKNEWSRFLKLMAKDKSKVLIPCYKDMDAYDMPNEFKALQAQDLGKVGAVQDLLRGIEKILQKEIAKTETVVINANNTNTAPLLKRAFMFLEDEDWNSADEYCEKVLDINPQCAEAYLGKLMAELKVKSKADLKNQPKPFGNSNNLQKVMRFGDDTLKKEIQDIISFIVNRNLENAYNNAVSFMQSANTEDAYKKAAELFEELQDFKDSKNIAQDCLAKAEEIRLNEEEVRLNRLYNRAVDMFNKELFLASIRIFEKLENYKDSKTFLDKAKCKAEQTIQLAPVARWSRYLCINEAGDVIKTKTAIFNARCFGENGLAAVKSYDQLWGFVDETGDMIIEPQFDDAYNFSENNLAPVKINDKWGYINELGDIVIKPQFDDARAFSENGLMAVELNGKWGFINENGKMVIEPTFDHPFHYFAENGLMAVELSGKWGFVDKIGNMVIKPQFDDADSFYESNLAAVKINDKWGYINELGDIVIKPQFDDARAFSENGLMAVELNGKWGYINEIGDMVIEPQFDDADSFYESNLAAVKINDKWGYINESGEMVIEPQFDDANAFYENGLAKVKLNDLWGFVDKTGNVVIKPRYNEVEPFAKNGLAEVKLNELWGYIDEMGDIVIECHFDNVGRFCVLPPKNISERNKRREVLKQEAEEKRLAERKRLANERQLAAERHQQFIAERHQRITNGVCQHCGGTFKGLFTKKCSSCGKEKDY